MEDKMKENNDAKLPVSVRLSGMQQFFLDSINQSNDEMNPNYLANIYYESIGKRRHSASRDSFGQTSAAYRTCRKLASLNLVKEIHHKSIGGYSYTMYSAFRQHSASRNPTHNP
jgi:hypothetical protein